MAVNTSIDHVSADDRRLNVLNPEFPGICVDPDGEVAFWHGGRDREAVRGEILRIKDHLLSADGLQVEMRVDHEFVDGMYIRRLFIAAGTLLVGKIHRKDCINVVEQGDISVLTEHGARRLAAGFTGVSRAGICKLGYAHTDTVFVNVFSTDATTVEAVEQEIACEDFEALGLLQEGRTR